MVSRAMTAIVSNRKKMSSRLVSSPLQSFCKMRRKKWTRSNLGEGEVGSVFIGDWRVVQRLCDSPVAWVDRHDITLVDLEVQPLRVDVVRFAEAVVIHLEHDGGGCVTVHNNDIVVQPEEAKV